MEIKFINSEFNFTLFPNIISAGKPSADINMNDLLEAIKHGYCRETIEKLRGASPKIEEYKDIKKTEIPCVTLSGIFNYRNEKGLIKHSGLIQIDIDEEECRDFLFEEICDNSYTYVCFKSPGGKGLKAIVKIKPSAETHLFQFLALEIYYKEMFGVKIDSQVKDISRAMLLSFDPDIYCNPWSNVFDETYIPESYPSHSARSSKKARKHKSTYPGNPTELIEKIINLIEEKNIDITHPYGNWLTIGFALCETFGEEGKEYFHRLSKFHPYYNFTETEQMYRKLLLKNDGRTKFGSIVYLAKGANIF